MAKRPGNPKNGRRLVGVAKAGPLFVNGVETPKGNVHKAISQMYRSSSRSLADAEGQMAEVILVRVTDPDRTCEHCLDPIERGETVAYEPSLDRAWHIRPRAGHTCRATWLRQHPGHAG